MEAEREFHPLRNMSEQQLLSLKLRQCLNCGTSLNFLAPEGITHLPAISAWHSVSSSVPIPAGSPFLATRQRAVFQHVNAETFRRRRSVETD